MTTPERGLFERIEPFLEPLHPNSAWRNRIKAEIEKFQQRLAEAIEGQAGALAQLVSEGGKAHCREETLKREIAQLRARCGELEGLVAAVAKCFEDGMPDKDDPRANMLRVLNLGAALTATPQPAQELCTAHKRFPCRECGTTHFDGCQCGFCKQVEQEQIAK